MCERKQCVSSTITIVECYTHNYRSEIIYLCRTFCEVNVLFIQYPGIYVKCMNCLTPKVTTTRRITTKKNVTKISTTLKATTVKAKASLVGSSDDILTKNKYKSDRYVARANEDTSAQPSATIAVKEADNANTTTKTTTPKTTTIGMTTKKQCLLIRSCIMKYLPAK